MRKQLINKSIKQKEVLSFDKHKLSYFLVSLVLVAICSIVLWNANWVFELFWADDYQFVSTTAIGRPSHAWTGAGRFWPLGLCDYCLLLLIPYGTTVTAHFIYNCITMIIASLLFFEFLKKLVGKHSYIPVFCMLILFSISSFVLIHMACIYPEREMFLMLSVFMFFYWKATNEGDNLRNYVVAFVAAAYTTYLKEPVFGMWIIFAITNLIFGKLSSRNRKFNYALLINSAIWIAIYTYRTIFRDRTFLNVGGEGYASVSSGISVIFSNFCTFFNQEPLLYVLLIISIIRAYNILRDKSEYNLCDALLFSGMGYAFAYVILNRQANHYCFPTIVMGGGILAVMLAESKNYMKMLLTCAPIVTSVCTIPNSISWIDKIITHRDIDPQMFTQLIAEQKSGKQILWVTEPGKEAINKINSREVDQMKFRRYQIFFDYYAGYRKEHHFPFKKVSDYSKIDKNTIVICSDETLASVYGKEINERVKEVGLTSIHSNNDLGTKMFWAE
ncbi:MAG: hypothetical protein IJT36_08305 [Alphaproteobacteria bacterium]|nr:hypothetical protein [Alphaproteobacteria bacterium]